MVISELRLQIGKFIVAAGQSLQDFFASAMLADARSSADTCSTSCFALNHC